MERRLAAILMADVVGYGRMIERDEARAVSLLKERRDSILAPLVALHRGRIVKFMGDGMLAEFGSAVNAVACALAIQQKAAAANDTLPEGGRLVLRIGVGLGDVIVEDGDVYGDGVNLAARLEAIAEPGTVYVPHAVHAQVQGKLAAQFQNLGEHSLKNIAEPVRVYRASAGEDGVASAGLDLSAKPSIAVLPFTNMSGDPEQEYFSDGITEDIITELSRFRNLFVIARNSSFSFKGKAVKIATVARELGVAYVLEGSVRRAGNRVRITAQLIDGETGSHIWADRYDRELADMFAVQDEIALKIVGMLTIGLEDDALDRARRKRPENLLAYDHWLRGKRLLWTMDQDNLAARAHFEKAAAADPGFSRAYSGLAVTFQAEALNFPIASESAAAYEYAYRAALKALDLDEADYQAHMALAWPLLYRHDYERMKKHIDRAILLNPNDADTLANAAYLLPLYGEADRAVACAEAAIRLNPRHPDWYLSFLATALFTARRFPECLEVRKKVPHYFINSAFFYAALLAHMDRMEDARHWAQIAIARLAARPNGALAAGKGYIQLLMENNPYRRREDRDLFAEGMRKAGVPG